MSCLKISTAEYSLSIERLSRVPLEQRAQIGGNTLQFD